MQGEIGRDQATRVSGCCTVWRGSPIPTLVRPCGRKARCCLTRAVGPVGEKFRSHWMSVRGGVYCVEYMEGRSSRVLAGAQAELIARKARFTQFTETPALVRTISHGAEDVDEVPRDVKRRGRDSNPGYRKRYTGFRDRRLQPLGHLSTKLSTNIPNHGLRINPPEFP